MHLKTRNVNTAFSELVNLFRHGAVQSHYNSSYPSIRRTSSRNGDVLTVDEPVTITYSHPKERVLFNPVRDANPFFHVIEALWMLAGRNDVELPAYYVKRMREFSDDGKTLNGAYGYRWRKAQGPMVRINNTAARHGVDQLDVIVAHLKADPNSRRAVLQMWNVEDDLLKIGPKHSANAMFNGIDYSKDVCCNLSVMFSLREERRSAQGVGIPDVIERYLDMTVTNRSNDLLWGCLGANYVHFTFLQEYMAARLGAEVGLYHHFTNNLHVYVDRPDWKPEKLLYYDVSWRDFYDHRVKKTTPLVFNPLSFDIEVKDFLLTQCGNERKTMGFFPSEPFIDKVAIPMALAYDFYRDNKSQDAMRWAEQIEDDAWRIACVEWLERRIK